MQWLEQPAIKWAIPIPLFLAVAPVVWWFFRSTWRKLDADALAYRRGLAERGEIQGALGQVSNVTGVTVTAMTEGYARNNLAYMGGTDQLREAMSGAGLSLTNRSGQWVLVRAGP